MKSGAWAAAIATVSFASPAHATCQLVKADLPVTMSGLRPLVTAKLNAQDALFLADSGAFYSLISPASAAQYHLRTTPLPYSFHLRGIGGEADASVTTVKSFSLAGEELKNIDFIVGGSEVGENAVGVIGQNVLHVADVEYDLAHGVIRLVKARGCEHSDLAYWAGTNPYSEMPIEWPSAQSPHTIGTATVNGAKIRVVFDTGAATSFLSVAAAARAGMKPNSPGVLPAGLSRGLGRSVVRSWIAPVASFEIGGEKITNTRLRIGDTSLPNGDMLLGADFFLSHRIYVSNGQRKLYFTYNGGPVFNLARAPESATPAGALPSAAQSAQTPYISSEEPKDADEFSRRGAAFAARHDDEHAISDFGHAIELAPKEARYLRQRALARIALRQPFLAMGDLDAALRLKPEDVETRVTRAQLRLIGRDLSGARADLDAADQGAAREADVRYQLGQLYLAADLFDPAISQLDLWLAAHRQDSRLAFALNGRCRARVLANRELDRAVSDCNAAARAAPKAAPPLENRGLVRLRQNDSDRAITDFDAVLAIQPKNALALYGRGLARLRKGAKAEGDADIAAARTLVPALPTRMAKLGFAP